MNRAASLPRAAFGRGIPLGSPTARPLRRIAPLNMNFRPRLRLASALALTLGSLLFAAPLPAQTLSLPVQPPPLKDLPKDRPYELRVLYLEDPRLPTLEPAQRAELYTKLQRLAATWLGYRVSLREVGHHALSAYFSAHDTLFAAHAAEIRAIAIEDPVARGAERLRAAIARDFRLRPLPLIERYLRAGPLTTPAAAVETALRQFSAKLTELRATPLADGTPFFDATQPHLTSFAYWAVLMEQIREADFVFTNSMIAGADTGMPLYVIARGGLTTGLTHNNDRNPYQNATMVGLFPFLSDAPVFLRERGRIPDDERLDVIATFCLHELGHFFLRYTEYYDHPRCVHVAPTGLNYYAWHQAVRAAGPCLLPHRKTPRF